MPCLDRDPAADPAEQDMATALSALVTHVHEQNTRLVDALLAARERHEARTTSTFLNIHRSTHSCREASC